MGLLRQRLGMRLRRLRQAHHLTQEALAAKADTDAKYLGAVERGQANIGLDKIEKLARALGVDAAELLVDDEARADAALDRFVRRASALYRQAGAAKRRLMSQIVEDVGSLYGKERR